MSEMEAKAASEGIAVAEPEVLTEVVDGVGRLTLNRPKAINALNHNMVKTLTATLIEWAADDDVAVVVLTGAGERGLCAGGDIRAIYQDALSGNNGSLDFWRDEYRLNALIAEYPKPFVAIMHGLVLGGGVGLAAHASFRIVTHNTQIGMPEVTIGFVPDVGGTYLLSRHHREMNLHAALTSYRYAGPDAIVAGLADYWVPEPDIPAFVSALSGGVENALSRYADRPPPALYYGRTMWVEDAFSAPTVEEIVQRLRAADDFDANEAADQIEKASPVALKVTLRSLREAAGIESLQAALNVEYAVGSVALKSHDFAEGVRAQIVDKDRNPQWSPASLSEVSDELVDGYFAPVPDLPFP